MMCCAILLSIAGSSGIMVSSLFDKYSFIVKV